MTAFATLRTALKKRAAYARTKRELANVPHALALEDLGFYTGDADKIAHKAVYG
jgi:uncharacterized protein YjiS (DUF1127 family)